MPGMKEHRNLHALALFLFWQKKFFVLCSVLRSRAKIFSMLCSVLCSRVKFFSCSVLFYVLRFIFCVLLWSIAKVRVPRLRNWNIIFLSPHRPDIVRLYGAYKNIIFLSPHRPHIVRLFRKYRKYHISVSALSANSPLISHIYLIYFWVRNVRFWRIWTQKCDIWENLLKIQ